MQTPHRLRRIAPSLFAAIAVLAAISVAVPSSAQTAPPPPPNLLTLTIDVESHEASQPAQFQTTAAWTRAVSRNTHVSLSVAQHDRFDDLDTQLTAGLGHAFSGGRFTLSGSVGAGVSAETVARRTYGAQLGLGAFGHVRPMAGFRRRSFAGDVNVNVWTAGAAFTAGRVSGRAAYQGSYVAHLDETGHGGLVDASTRFNRHVSLAASVGYGAEHTFADTVVEASRSSIETLTLAVGPSFHLAGGHVLNVMYTFEDKRTLYRVSGLRLVGAFGF